MDSPPAETAASASLPTPTSSWTEWVRQGLRAGTFRSVQPLQSEDTLIGFSNPQISVGRNIRQVLDELVKSAGRT